MVIDFKWPKENADFYKSSGAEKYRLELYCNKGYSESFYEYAVNFKVAGHLVTEYILEKAQIGMLDTYFFVSILIPT